MSEPITVDPSPTLAVAGQTIRNIGTIIAGAATLAGALKGHDLMAVATWMQSDAVLPFLTALATLGMMAYGISRTILNRRKLVIAARAAPDSVATVKGDPA